MNKEKDLSFAEATAKEAGTILMQYFGSELTKSIKSHPGDFATEADIESERYILAEIRKKFPNDSIVVEESGKQSVAGSEHTWIVDPLDGTHNFTNRSKNFGVMICRAKGNSIEVAVVYNPAKKIFARATLGGGTFLNGKRIDLMDMRNSDQTRISANTDLHSKLKSLGEAHSCKSAIGSTLNSLAGQYQAHAASVGFIWDFAPPALLLAEAGWKVTDMKGEPFRWTGKVEYGHPGVIAAPPELHNEIVSSLEAKN